MTTTQNTSDLSVTRTEHPNATRMREGFEAFARGDLEAVHAQMADDCTWTNPGTSPLAGTHRGWDEISGMFMKLFEITGGTNRSDVISVLADDERSIAVFDGTSTVAGQTRTMRSVLINELTPDGLIRAAQLLSYDQAAADAHMSGTPQS